MAIVAFSYTAHAGVIIFPGKMNQSEFVPAEKSEKAAYEIRYSTITSVINRGKASTEVEETIMGPISGDLEAIGIIPLPQGSDPKSVRVEIKDKGALTPKMLSAEEATTFFQKLAKITGSANLLTYSGRPAALIESMTLDRKTELKTTLVHPVAKNKKIRTFTCPMPSPEFASKPVERLTVSVTLNSGKAPIHSLFSTTHAVDVERITPNQAKIKTSIDKYAEQEDLKLLYVLDRDLLGVHVITHRAEGEKEGYFMLLAHPTGDEETIQTIEKDIIFALDVSGSMRGEKMEQARSAIEYCLSELNDGDRFNVIAFGTDVKSFKPDVVEKSEQTLKDAQDFVDDLVAVGRTNIGDAMKKGLAGKPEKGRLRILVFMTDGTPTSGELIPEKILAGIPEMNTSKATVYVVGVGHDVNAHLLDQIAESTDGETEYVNPDEEIDEKVAALYNRLSHPVLTDVNIAYAQLNTHAIYPKKVPTLFKGGDVMVIGRYKEGGETEVTISGTLAGEPKSYSYSLDFKKGDQAEHDYVATLWASRKIGFLLQEIRLHGKNPELIEEVVRLSKQFGIVTEYTAFIARSGGEIKAEASVLAANEQLSRARAQKGGEWAVNQARNDLSLQKQTIASRAGNKFRNKRGEEEQSDRIKQVGRRVFYQRDNGNWFEADQITVAADAAPAPAAPVREVKRFSDEYFSLIKEDKDFAKAQALGENVSVKVGKEIINVK